MFLEAWQIIGLSFVAAVIGGAVVRIGMRRQFEALHTRFVIAGGDMAQIKTAIESNRVTESIAR
ncbi:MAG: hypothetical protein IT539_13780 [Bradyrhizobiaceae bacterium]|nr:hypothetical protein [Bradyrhizobiaceae bacterium]